MFNFGGDTYTLAEMLAANHDDEDVTEWLRTAQIGDIYPGSSILLQRIA